MIRSNLPQIKLSKERELGHKITYQMIKNSAGISGSTIARLMSLGQIKRIDASTLSGLRNYFNCQ